MNDLITITAAFACLLATFALIRLCDRLAPKGTGGREPGSHREENHP
jgi:hypothetical protein